MLEMVKAALDLAGSQISLKDILERKDRRDINKIGLFLLDIYNKSGDIIDEGYVIIDGIQHLVDRHAYYFSCGAVESTVYSAQALKPTLALQAANLYRFVQALNINREIIETINPQAFSGLRETSLKKMIWLGGLDAILYPQGVNDLSGSTVDSLGAGWLQMEIEQASNSRTGDVQIQSVEGAFADAALRLRHRSGDNPFGSIPWSKATCELVKLYLESGVASRRLQQVEDARQSLRDSIVESFDIKQLLLAAGKRTRRRF